MKNIISQEEKNRIDAICERYNIQDYDILNDGSINVNEKVFLKHQNLTRLPLKFNVVLGGFNCMHNQLTTLEGAPKSVYGNFECNNNQLESLEFAPKSVGGDFNCSNNNLVTLEHAPSEVGGEFNCKNNYLTTLKGCPSYINGNFNCKSNELTTLEFCPETIADLFYCSNNKISTLKYYPKKTGTQSRFSDNYDHNPLPSYFTTEVDILASKELKDIVHKYMNHFGVWTEDGGFDKDAFDDLLTDIEEGLR